MRRFVACAIVLGAVLLQSSPATAGLYYGFQIGVSNAPPPPLIRKVREPAVERANDAMVYVVVDDRVDLDADAFHYGQYWFVYSNKYWYRSMEFRGPYHVIDVRKVPRAILGVPKTKWKHHPHGGPPGQMKKARVVVEERGRGGSLAARQGRAARR